MNKKLMSIFALAVLVVGFAPKSFAGGGDVAAGAVVGGVTGFALGTVLSKDQGDPVAKEEARQMRDEAREERLERMRRRRAAERKARREEMKQEAEDKAAQEKEKAEDEQE